MRLPDPSRPEEHILPLMDGGRVARSALSGFLAVGALVLVVFFLGNDAGALGKGPVVAQPESTARIAAPAQTANGIGNYPNCRFGVGQVCHSVVSYNVPSINLGWYVSWGTQASPPRPGGMEYAQMLRVSGSGYSPSGAILAGRIAANPGALWIIGNEPDCIYQDNVLPQEYAQAYHDAYSFIKMHDPAAHVTVGGIVQPTPLRMEYLDIVLNTYTALYGEPLPTDAWNIHTFILREASCTAYPDSCWGAGIPPGIAADHGILYALDDIDRLDIFQDRIVQFRQWMRDRGYRDTPLIITEYGTLLPYYDPGSLYYDSGGDPFNEARARDFMYGTFDFLLTASDPNLGYAADENRLVQRWLWYSLDDASYGGALFDPLTLDPMQLGTDFGAYTASISPTVDLFAVDVGQMEPVPYSPTSTVTVTLRARISNIGNVAITQPVSIRFLDGDEHQIGSDWVISETV
ncbi:MAG: hypothetical protein KAX26_14900, partial [Anaerolineae bacterium]|nr:hypothetical protein [Anaerolineae bacterium]